MWCSHEVRVHFATVERDEDAMRNQLVHSIRVYQQYGINIRCASSRVLGLSIDAFDRLSTINTQCDPGTFSAEQIAFLRHADVGIPQRDILVCVPNRLIGSDGGGLKGCASHPVERPALFICRESMARWTLAHELGHVLLARSYYPVHHELRSNVMYRYSTDIYAATPTFDLDQISAIRQSPLLHGFARR